MKINTQNVAKGITIISCLSSQSVGCYRKVPLGEPYFTMHNKLIP